MRENHALTERALGKNRWFPGSVAHGIGYALLWVQSVLGMDRDARKMKTLLRRVSTGLYFQGPDRWTSDPGAAHNFKMIDRALQFIHRWKLQDVELAFAFEKAGQVTRVPIDKIAVKYSEG